MIMLAVTATCVYVEPTSGIVVGILLSLGKGAFDESKAWVLCKLRQGDSLVARFNCDLVLCTRPMSAADALSSLSLRRSILPLGLRLTKPWQEFADEVAAVPAFLEPSKRLRIAKRAGGSPTFDEDMQVPPHESTARPVA
jgi:hypothetical protein